MLDERRKPTIIDLGDVDRIEYINNRWQYKTAAGLFHDPSNALEYATLFSDVPFLKANQTTLLNMKKVYYVAARKAHTTFGVIIVTRENQIKLRKYFKSLHKSQNATD